jgi:HlyD family secretion protein
MGAVAKRILVWLPVAVVLLAALAYAFRPRPELVDVEALAPGPLTVTVDAEGVTRFQDVFTISAPVAGRLLRTPLEPGDPVIRGETVVATIEPADPTFLDPRTLAERRAELEEAQAARQAAEAELEEARAEQTFAHAELERARELFAAGSVARRFVEEAERAARAADAAVAAAEAALEAKAYQVVRARARLLTPVERDAPAECADCLYIAAPVDGRVMRVFEEDETVVAPGAPLLELGNPDELEVVADFLSADAVHIRPGQPALIDGWGGEGELEAVVRQVEPFGFTEVSALGIEEQRVNVVFDLVSPRQAWSPLGHGYRVIARVVLWEDDQVLTVPVTALYRDGPAWYVFAVEDGRAGRRAVVPGRRSGLRVQVLDGLEAGDLVVTNPPDSLEDGVRVARRGGA